MNSTYLLFKVTLANQPVQWMIDGRIATITYRLSRSLRCYSLNTINFEENSDAAMSAFSYVMRV